MWAQHGSKPTAQLGSTRGPVDRPVLKPFETFVHAESSGGILLLGATLVAMVWANSPWADSYARLWSTPVSLVVGSHALTETLLEWINAA